MAVSTEPVDPVTGMPIPADAPAWVCAACGTAYAPASYALVRREWGGVCVGCGGRGTVRAPSSGTLREKKPAPLVRTTAGIDRYLGRRIVFEGVPLRAALSAKGEMSIEFDGFAIVVPPPAWGRYSLRLAPVLDAARAGRAVRVGGIAVREPGRGPAIVIGHPAQVEVAA